MLRKILYYLSGNFISHDWITRHVRYGTMLLCLVVVYLVMMYCAGRQQRRYTELGREVTDLRNEYIALEAERSSTTLESSVYRHLNERGSELQPNVESLIRIDE